MASGMEGIGGFAEAVDRFILITGKHSAYRSNETEQYIVSAAFYAAYLSLTLHLYGIGACVVQRSVVWTEKWGKWRKRFGIPADEQQVVMLAVGSLKESFRVPVSHRLSEETMIRMIR